MSQVWDIVEISYELQMENLGELSEMQMRPKQHSVWSLFNGIDLLEKSREIKEI